LWRLGWSLIVFELIIQLICNFVCFVPKLFGSDLNKLLSNIDMPLVEVKEVNLLDIALIGEDYLL
jgi:hypothetical protein